jgi:hypothetical protein
MIGEKNIWSASLVDRLRWVIVGAEYAPLPENSPLIAHLATRKPQYNRRLVGARIPRPLVYAITDRLISRIKISSNHRSIAPIDRMMTDFTLSHERRLNHIDTDLKLNPSEEKT